VGKNVTFKELLDSFAVKRKLIIAVSLVSALLVGVFGFYNSFRQMQKISTTDEQAVVKKAHIDGILEIRKSQLTEQIMNLEEYIKESLLFNLPILQVPTTQLSFIVETDYKINPKLAIQSPDRTPLFISAYRYAYLSDIFFKNARVILKHDLKETHILDLIEVQIFNNENIININAFASDLQQSSALASLVLEQMQNTVTKSLGEHKIIIINQHSFLRQDYNLLKRLEEYSNILRNLSSDYNNLDNSMRKLKNALASILSLPPIHWGGIIASGVRFAIVGFVLGMIVIMIVLSIHILNDTRIHSVNDLGNNFSIRLLGDLSEDRKSKTQTGKTQEERQEIATNNIIALLSCQIQTLLFIGSEKQSGILMLIKNIADKKSIDIELVDTTTDELLLPSKLATTDAVVLSIQKSVDEFKTVKEWLNLIENFQKPLIGVILV